MSRRISPSAGKPYGVRRVCRAWRIAPSSYYARKRREAEGAGEPRRRGPRGLHSDEEILRHVRELVAAEVFAGEGYRKLWARLRWRGIHVSKERLRRLLREHRLQAPRRVGRPRGPRAHDGRITTEVPNRMWGTDITTTVLATGQQVNVFVVVDHCGLYCHGIHASVRATRWEALEPIRQGLRANFGPLEAGCAHGLALRHDHGSQYMARDFQQELRFFGVRSSPAFVRAPEGNGCAEWFIRVLKENLLWLHRFETIDELNEALQAFRQRYNHGWILGKYGNRTPAQIYHERLLKEAA